MSRSAAALAVSMYSGAQTTEDAVAMDWDGEAEITQVRS